MDKSNFPNGVPATGSDWRFESEANQKRSKRNLRDGFQVGVRDGLTVAILTGDPTKVEVQPGNGYVGDTDFGDRVDSNFGSFILLSSSVILDAPSGGWVASTKYYVNLVYNEDVTLQRPEVDGLTLQDVRTESTTPDATLEIITDTAYLALSDSDKHDRLKLAIVVPSGTSLVDGDIELPWVIERVKTAGTLLLSGVTLIDVSSTATSGTSEIEWDYAGSQIRWRDAGDVSFGAWVSITADGLQTFESSTTSKFIEANITVALLPVSSGVYDIAISDLYEGEIRPSSGADRLLRSYGGTALKTRTNPLGLSATDLGGGDEDVKGHRVYMHHNGMVGVPGMLGATIVGAVEDYLSFTVPAGSDRFFIRGNAYTAIDSSENPSTPGANYTIQFDDYLGDNWSLFEVYIDEQSELKRNRRAQLSGVAIPNVEGVIPLDINLFVESGTFTLDYANTSTTEKTLQFNSGRLVTLIPNEDRLYELFGENEYDKLVVYVDWSELSTAPSESDTWNVENAPIDEDTGLLLCGVSYFNSEIFGIDADWTTGGGTALDRRLFGSLGVEDFTQSDREFIRTTALDEVKFVGREIINNGVFVGLDMTLLGDVITVKEGRGYVKGDVVDITTDQTLDFTGVSDGNYYIWLNRDGVLEFLAEPLDGSSDIMEEVLWDLMKERCVLAKVIVSGGSVDSFIDKRSYVGIGEVTREENDDILGVGFPQIIVRKSPSFSSGRFLTIGDEVYMVDNLIYNEITGLWHLENPSNYGSALVVTGASTNDKFMSLRKKDAGTTPSSLDEIQQWPGNQNFVSMSNRFGGYGYLGDVSWSGAVDLGKTRVFQFKNLTVESGAVVTGAGPYVVILVEDTIEFKSGSLLDFSGKGVISSRTPSNLGCGGQGGRGGNQGPALPGDPGFSGWYEWVTYNTWTDSMANYMASDGVGQSGGNPIFPYALAGGGGGGGGGDTIIGSGGAGGGYGGDGGGVAGNGQDGLGTLSGYGWNDLQYIDLFTSFIPPMIFQHGGVRGWGGGGAGGSAAANGGVDARGGAGGNGGGAIYIEAKNVIFPSSGVVIDVSGGDGSNRPPSSGGGSNNAGAGGGGGGGSVLIACHNETNYASARIDTSGGLGGTVVYDGGDGGDGLKALFDLNSV